MLQVTGLYIYPVKSCAGFPVPNWTVTRYGFRHDREFLVVDEWWSFVTQRTHPKLALVQTFPEPDLLRLRAPNLPEMTFPWLGSRADHPIESRRPVTIWRDQVEADDCGKEIAEWFSAHLGCKVRLVRMGERYRRTVRPENVPAVHQEALGIREVGFADASPFLIISEASLADLNHRLPQPIPMDRFRPNIVVGGVLDSYAEDRWQSIDIGALRFRNGAPCIRCVVTTTDQITLERGPEPLKTLATYRRNSNGGVHFGMNFFCESSTGTIRVGDVIRLIPNDMANDK
jgi:MOSC domain-containing protein